VAIHVDVTTMCDSRTYDLTVSHQLSFDVILLHTRSYDIISVILPGWRFRRLADMDPNRLSEYDNLMLHNVDRLLVNA